MWIQNSWKHAIVVKCISNKLPPDSGRYRNQVILPAGYNLNCVPITHYVTSFTIKIEMQNKVTAFSVMDQRSDYAAH